MVSERPAFVAVLQSQLSTELPSGLVKAVVSPAHRMSESSPISVVSNKDKKYVSVNCAVCVEHILICDPAYFRPIAAGKQTYFLLCLTRSSLWGCSPVPGLAHAVGCAPLSQVGRSG